jgi:hypothetical protein
VLPQPVYMNMSDLAHMAAQKAAHIHNSNPDINFGRGGGDLEDESPELQTPTADQHGMITGPPPPQQQQVHILNGANSQAVTQPGTKVKWGSTTGNAAPVAHSTKR